MEHVWLVCLCADWEGIYEQFVCGTEKMAGAKARQLRDANGGVREWKAVGEYRWDCGSEHIVIEKHPVIWEIKE